METCPFQGSLDLLGRRHTLTLLWLLQKKTPRRFNDLREAAGVNPVTLSQRLAELEKAGVLSRHAYAETPPRVEYDLTPRGLKLLEILDVLQGWSRAGQAAATPSA